MPRRGRARRTRPAGWSPASPGEQPDDLRRVQRAAPARRDDPLRALVERLERLGRWVVDLDDRRRDPAGVKKRSTRVARCVHPARAGARGRAASRSRVRRSSGARRVDQRVDLLRGELDHRPHVQQHAVPLQAPVRRAVAPGSHGSPRAPSTSIRSSSGSGDDAPVLVADRGEVAHLGEGEQPLVLGVRRERRRGRRRRPRPTAARSRANFARRHRCRRSPIIGCSPRSDLVLDQAARPGAEGEQVDGRHAAAAPRLGDRDDDPLGLPRGRARRRAPSQRPASSCRGGPSACSRRGRPCTGSPSGSVAAWAAHARAAVASSRARRTPSARWRVPPLALVATRSGSSWPSSSISSKSASSRAR